MLTSVWNSPRATSSSTAGDTLVDEPDTIAAVATAPGRGAVAVVRVSGPAAFSIATRLSGRDVSAALAGRFLRATLCDRDDVPLDDALLLVFAAPKSYTGEDVVEFQTHGGAVTPARVLEACIAAGARLARRGEFTLRAFLNGRMDLSCAEAVIDLVDARTERAASDALARLGGALTAPFEKIYSASLDLSAKVEHALDLSEDELPSEFFAECLEERDALVGFIDSVLATAHEGRLLREGALVVISGPPNAGKSSLMNALLGENRVIVSPAAGTTRDSVEESISIDGFPVRLVDTAGLRTTADAVEEEGVARAEKLAASADIVLSLDGAEFPNGIAVHSKCDLGHGPGLNVSSKTGEGLDALKLAIAAKLREMAARPDEAEADVSARQREVLERARTSLVSCDPSHDLVLAANAFRTAAQTIGELLGRVYSEDMLDNLFSRFCVGK